MRIFPAPDVLAGLVEEAKSTTEDEKWEKGEEYFLKVVEMKSLKQRLQVWQFKFFFQMSKDPMIAVLKSFEQAFEEIRTSKHFRNVLSFILSLGNILNGGTQKGQADGFYLDALSKTTTLRDANNKTIMAYICENLKKQDEDFVNFKDQFKQTYHVAKYSLKDEETKITEVQGAYNKAKNNFDIVIKQAKGNSDPFIEKLTVYLNDAQKQIEEFQKKMEHCKKVYKETCQFFLIQDSDEKAQNSVEFFKFFT